VSTAATFPLSLVRKTFSDKFAYAAAFSKYIDTHCQIYRYALSSVGSLACCTCHNRYEHRNMCRHGRSVSGAKNGGAYMYCFNQAIAIASTAPIARSKKTPWPWESRYYKRQTGTHKKTAHERSTRAGAHTNDTD
jgi:hypothetical protein